MKEIKIFCFDIDNIICKTSQSNYKKSTPNIRVIKLINALYDQGHQIKIFTARFMGRNNENIYKAKKSGFLFTKKQLSKWNIKYHKLIFGKPTYDFFIDDRAMGYKTKWINEIKKISRIKINI